MSDPALLTRFVRLRLLEALADTPVVLVHGPRQCGKTTLARTLTDYAYITFDDAVQLAAAKADPVGFVADLSERVILDEVQRVPELFALLKAVVDRDRRPGRFVLTGSANVLLAPELSDSLAGRMGLLRLHPLAQTELAGVRSGFIHALFERGFRAKALGRLGAELAETHRRRRLSCRLGAQRRPAPARVVSRLSRNTGAARCARTGAHQFAGCVAAPAAACRRAVGAAVECQ